MSKNSQQAIDFIASIKGKPKSGLTKEERLANYTQGSGEWDESQGNLMDALRGKKYADAQVPDYDEKRGIMPIPDKFKESTKAIPGDFHPKAEVGGGGWYAINNRERNYGKPIPDPISDPKEPTRNPYNPRDTVDYGEIDEQYAKELEEESKNYKEPELPPTRPGFTPGYGARIGAPPFSMWTHQFLDNDGDGIDDRDQRGPGQGRGLGKGSNSKKAEKFLDSDTRDTAMNDKQGTTTGGVDLVQQELDREQDAFKHVYRYPPGTYGQPNVDGYDAVDAELNRYPRGQTNLPTFTDPRDRTWNGGDDGGNDGINRGVNNDNNDFDYGSFMQGLGQFLSDYINTDSGDTVKKASGNVISGDTVKKASGNVITKKEPTWEGLENKYSGDTSGISDSEKQADLDTFWKLEKERYNAAKEPTWEGLENKYSGDTSGISDSEKQADLDTFWKLEKERYNNATNSGVNADLIIDDANTDLTDPSSEVNTDTDQGLNDARTYLQLKNKYSGDTSGLSNEEKLADAMKLNDITNKYGTDNLNSMTNNLQNNNNTNVISDGNQNTSTSEQADNFVNDVTGTVTTDTDQGLSDARTYLQLKNKYSGDTSGLSNEEKLADAMKLNDITNKYGTDNLNSMTNNLQNNNNTNVISDGNQNTSTADTFNPYNYLATNPDLSEQADNFVNDVTGTVTTDTDQGVNNNNTNVISDGNQNTSTADTFNPYNYLATNPDLSEQADNFVNDVTGTVTTDTDQGLSDARTYLQLKNKYSGDTSGLSNEEKLADAMKLNDITNKYGTDNLNSMTNNLQNNNNTNVISDGNQNTSTADTFNPYNYLATNPDLSEQADNFVNDVTGTVTDPGVNNANVTNNGNQNTSVTDQAENLINMVDQREQQETADANAYLSGENVDRTTASTLRTQQIRQGLENGTIDINDLTPAEQAHFSDTVALTPEQRMRDQVTNWYKTNRRTADEDGINFWMNQLSREGADFDTIRGHFERTAARDNAADDYENIFFSRPPADMTREEMIRRMKDRLRGGRLTNSEGQLL